MKKKAIVIVGPTASGKTSLGVYVAKKFGGEVISADSMQIYKDIAISTAKPTEDEMCGIKHHLIDFLDVTEQYSVSDYCKDARRCFDDITIRGKLPVIVGGTGLYIDSFLSNTEFLDNASSPEVKEKLKAQLQEKGIEHMYDMLKDIDPVAAEKIHPNNTVRVLRALEVYYSTGKTISEQVELSHSVESDIDPLYIGITYNDREKLYDRINHRVDIMVSMGLVEEAKAFFSNDYSKTSFNSIGCKEIKPYIDDVSSLEECLERLKLSTRRYAKRQLTWFRRNEKINWVYPDMCTADELYKSVDEIIENYLEGESDGES